jgi:hypothetical protein
MTRRNRLALAAASLIALSTLGAALPAAATPVEPPPVVEAAAPDECPRWGWKELNMWMEATLRNRGRGGYQLSIFDGTTAGRSTTDLLCVTKWEFIYSHPTDPRANRVSISLDLRSSASKVTEIKPGSTLPKTDMTPQQAIDAMRAHGYDEPFRRLWLAPAQSGSGAAEYEFFTDKGDHILIDAKTGRVSSYEFPDLPDDVIALRAATVSGGGTYTAPEFRCPDRRPFVWKQGFGRGLPGTQFLGASFGSRVGLPALFTIDGLVAGWPETPAGIFAPRDGEDDTKLYAFCTDDPAEGYTPPAAAE